MSNPVAEKTRKKQLRAHRIRALAKGTGQQPRLSVNVSNRHIIAQIIDDSVGRTLAYVSTAGDKAAQGTMTQRAEKVGADIAKKARSAKVKKVVFDRGSRLYHGRVKALADAARKEGLEF